MISYAPHLVVIIIPLLVLFIAWIILKWRYKLSRLKLIGGDLPQPTGKRGIILLVSNPDSAMHAIEYHFVEKKTLEHIWLIPSNDSARENFGANSFANAEEIKTRCENLERKEGRELKVKIYEGGASPADSQDTFDYVNRTFRRSGYAPDEIIADFTGGTKPMSVGMIMACLPSERELEYVSYTSTDKRSHGPFLIDYQHSAFDLIG